MRNVNLYTRIAQLSTCSEVSCLHFGICLNQRFYFVCASSEGLDEPSLLAYAIRTKFS